MIPVLQSIYPLALINFFKKNISFLSSKDKWLSETMNKKQSLQDTGKDELVHLVGSIDLLCGSSIYGAFSSHFLLPFSTFFHAE